MRNEKSLPKYLINEIFKISAFFISEKAAPKNGQSSKGCCFIVEKFQVINIGEVVKLYQYFQNLF